MVVTAVNVVNLEETPWREFDLAALAALVSDLLVVLPHRSTRHAAAVAVAIPLEEGAAAIALIETLLDAFTGRVWGVGKPAEGRGRGGWTHGTVCPAVTILALRSLKSDVLVSVICDSTRMFHGGAYSADLSVVYQ